MEEKTLIIIGAGGHGKVVRNIAKRCGYIRVFFLDDRAPLSEDVIGKSGDYIKYKNSAFFFVAIGNGAVRKKVYDELCLNQAEIITLVDPDSVIAEDVKIGCGSVIMPGTVINSNTEIGMGVIINTCASVDHDCVVKDFAHISVGAHLCGTVEIGDNVWVGAGATVINNISICDNCMIGAGAAVVKDIKEPGIYKGVPARYTYAHESVR